MAVYKFAEFCPVVHESAFVSESADIIGDVHLEENSSVWFGAVLRADDARITVRAGTSIQENAVLHVDDGFPLEVGPNVTVGHQAMLHGCTVKEQTLIGMQAIVMDGAVIERNCIVGAGAVVPAGTTYPEGSLILGCPAKAVRALTEAEIANLKGAANFYVNQRHQFKHKLVRIG
jgi:carbonic anhydrase/acetyltransferase-like protein (isoleucine patch superfamily)